MAAAKRLQKIVDALAKKHEVDGKAAELTELRDPFTLGAWYILGQHAKRNGQNRAYEALRRAKGISPGKLLDIAPEKLTSICQIAGPYDDARAKDLYAYADAIEEKCGQDFGKIFKGSAADVRKFLEVDLKRTREFTDFLLLYGGQFPIFPMDARIARVASRLGFSAPPATKKKGEKSAERTPDDLQKALESEAPKDPAWLIRAHALFYRHANDLCHAGTPNCYSCPLTSECAYFKTNPPPPKEEVEKPVPGGEAQAR